MQIPGIKTRTETNANYRSVYCKGKTLRFAIDPDKPITELKWPEFYDVAINNWCGGACKWCYTSALPSGVHFSNIVDKINTYFGQMTPEQRPYQVALGGAGEPTAHPNIISVLETFSSLGIVPNITTNGMHITPELISAIKSHCGGVAVSLHPHLEKYWQPALDLFIAEGIRTNCHVIISGTESIDFLGTMYEKYKKKVDYFVLLPHMNVGRGGIGGNKVINYEYLEKWLDGVYTNGDLAFGANFYEFLKQHRRKYNVSIYPPEIMSKYLILDDNYSLYNNSFEMKKVANPVELKF